MDDQAIGLDGPNAAQVEYWNSPSAIWWVTEQERIDRQFAPLTEALMERAAPAPGERVVDIGCGCGATVLAAAGRVLPSGRVLGLDVSAPMVARARERLATAGAGHAEVVLDDAAAHPFAGEADLMVSRLGVMFFADPGAAFAHLLSAMRPGGRLAFVCWRSLEENPWFALPLQAARTLLPPAEPSAPGAPGPFAFADAGRVRAILADAGWREVEIVKLDLRIVMAGAGQPDQAALSAVTVGPLARALADAPPDLRDQVQAAVTQAMAAYDGPGGIALPSALWLVTARA